MKVCLGISADFSWTATRGMLFLFFYLGPRGIFFVCLGQGLFPVLVFRSATAAGRAHT